MDVNSFTALKSASVSAIGGADGPAAAAFSPSDVAMTCLVGVLIVFSVLAVIWLSLAIMERFFRKGDKKKQPITVVSPFDGVITSAHPLSEARQGEAVLTVVTDDDAVSEILSPASGSIRMCVTEDDRIKKGDTLFTIE